MMTRRAVSQYPGVLFFLITVSLTVPQAGAQEGFALTVDGLVVDRAEQWEQWTRPKHAVRIDPETHVVTPRRINRATNAILDIDDFQTLIGNNKAYDKLVKELNRADRPIPLNIRTAPATIAGVPIVYLKASEKNNIEVGDPIIWFYFHGGIRQAGTSIATASAAIDGDPTTYWEPSTLVTKAKYDDLTPAVKGPAYFFAINADGKEQRVDKATFDAASSRDRRVEYHSHSLENWTLDIDLGRLVPIAKVVLRFLHGSEGEPFRQVRLLGTPSDLRGAALSLIDRTIAPVENSNVVEFNLDPDDQGVFEQLHNLRIAVTDSKFDKFKVITAAEFAALPLDEQGGIDYHIVNAAGSETKVAGEIYDEVSPERRGRLVYYSRERPRLAEVEVWTQGDNIALEIIDGGGSVDLTGTFGGLPGFDGRFESKFLQFIWSPDPRFEDRGIMTLDLGARFWLDYFRMVGEISGVDEMIVQISDGTRDSNGSLKWREMHRQTGGTVESPFEKPEQVRYLTSQIFTSQGGRAGGYNTGDNIREVQLFGEGYPSEVTLTSPMIELPGSVILGRITWDADLPDEEIVDLQIRTRTGDRLVEVVEFYGSGGETKTEGDYNNLPTSFQGPIVNRLIPGGGWSSWSQRYTRSGQLITSPSPRRFLQIQARLLSTSPDLAASLQSVNVEFLPPVARQTIAEIWPDDVTAREDHEFELYLNPTFVERQPGGQVSQRFDEILLDATPIEAIELLDVSLGREEDFTTGQTRQFSEPGQYRDPATGATTPWFTNADGQRYQARINPDSGDSLKIFPAETGAGLLLHLPQKIALQPQGEDTRLYYRVIEEDGEEVPVDNDGRTLNELTYLGLSLEEQGNILYFAIQGRDADGKAILEAVEKFAYLSLADSLQGEIRYFRKLVGKGGEFPFDEEGNALTAADYNALSPSRQGAIVAAGELVQVRFRASILLNGTTVDASIRDSAFPETWQQVDPGDATDLRPGTALSIAVPFSPSVVQEVKISPNPFTPNGDGINDRTSIRFALGNLNIARDIQIYIFDLAGRRIWSGSQPGFGQQEFAWDGRADDGQTVAPGVYVCKIDAEVDAESASNTSKVHLISVAY
jgi:hypothetical protein